MAIIETSILSEIEIIVRNILNDTDSKINIDENILLSSLGLNSLERIDLICSIEEKYNISIPDEQIEQFETANDFISFIQSNS